MAIRRSIIEPCNLIERWSNAFCEDTLLSWALKKERLKSHRVANLIVENNETTSLPGCFEWLVRQLLTVRLHHPGWPLVMLHGLFTGIATIVAPFACVVLFVNGYFFGGRSVLLAWLIYQILNAVLLALIGIGNRKAMARRDVSRDHQSIEEPSGFQLIMAGILVQLLHPVAVIKTMFAQKVRWRDVVYRIAGRRIRVQH